MENKDIERFETDDKQWRPLQKTDSENTRANSETFIMPNGDRTQTDEELDRILEKISQVREFESERNKYKKRYSVGSKLVAFILCLVTSAIALLSVAGFAFLFDQNFYFQSKETLYDYYFNQVALSHLDDIVFSYANEGVDNRDIVNMCRDLGASIEIETIDQKYGVSNEVSIDIKWVQTYNVADELDWYLQDANNDISNEIRKIQNVTFYVSERNNNGIFGFISFMIEFGYWWRYGVIAVAVISALLALGSFVFLMCVVGRTPQNGEAKKNFLTYIPFEIVAFGFGFVELLLIDVLLYVFSDSDPFAILCAIVTFCIMFVLALLFCMDFAVRCKTGGLIKTTLLYSICKTMKNGIKNLTIFLLEALKSVPVFWQGLTIFGLLSAVMLFVALFELVSGSYPVFMFYIVIFERAVILALLLYAQFAFGRLIKGGKRMADGEVGYTVKTSHMYGAFKTHAEDLNQIFEGMNHAVDARMKSERMKTELITNVSHDIKTPLTSIINYSDLISKEPTNNIKILEYTEVISRQSERLKRLIEDLVEASKASTGNLEVELERFEVGVMVEQAAGEYNQRLLECNLDLIVKQSEEPIYIYADGRRLWRVFDNLLGNICKYAQTGTRVYLALEQKENKAVISFKNISRTELDISADDLMERFVRGDSSRATEGNGLGLSIAQSLVELQNGTMQLYVDGDLFKVEITFNIACDEVEV